MQNHDPGQETKSKITNVFSIAALIISAATTFLLFRENRRMGIILHYLDSVNSASIKHYNDTFAKAHSWYYIDSDGRYKLYTDSEIADIRAKANPWPLYSDSEIATRIRDLDSESLKDGVRYRYHNGHIFASKPNDTWPWLIWDSAAYKYSKWFGKMDKPIHAKWVQRGELIPDSATIK